MDRRGFIGLCGVGALLAPMKRLFGFVQPEQNALSHKFFPLPYDGPWIRLADDVDGYHCECSYRWQEGGDLVLDYVRMGGPKDNPHPWPTLTAVPDQKKVCFLSTVRETRFEAPMERKSLAELKQDGRFDPGVLDKLEMSWGI